MNRKTTGGNLVPVHIVSNDSNIDPSAFVTTYLLNATSNDMGVNGSVTPVLFTYSPPTGKNFLVRSLDIYMESGSAFDSVKFMHLAALSNGVTVSVNGTVIATWQDNIDVITDIFNLSNAGVTFSKSTLTLTGKWDFATPLLVENGSSVTITIQDDLSAAGIVFRAKVQGELI